MRSSFLAFLVTVTALASVFAGSLPLTLKEVTLMLRSGYSNDAVERELSARHLAESCDARTEKSLKDAGASPALIDAIRNGSYQSSPEEVEAARKQLTAQAQKNAAEKETLRTAEILNQKQRAQAKNLSTAPIPTSIRDVLKGDLVYWKNGTPAHYDDGALEKKQVFALYFSAHWCGPCRKFTPKLVDFYNRIAPQHPEFEIVFVSADKSLFAMEKYLSEMPWPAVEFGKLSGKTGLKQLGGDSIPSLLVLDAGGRVLFSTYVNQQYAGPEHVLVSLDSFFAKGSNTPLAATR